MPSPSANRSYSAPPSPHSIAAQYSWSPTFVQTGGGGGPITGNWIPQQVDTSGAMLVSSSGPVNYGFNSVAITGSQVQVPAGAWSWSVFVESGVAFVNGLLYNTSESLQGGGYDGNKRLGTAINIGCTGTVSGACRTLVAWEA